MYSTHASPWNGRYCAGTVLAPVCKDGTQPNLRNDASGGGGGGGDASTAMPMPMICRASVAGDADGEYSWQTEDGQVTRCV
jgi:hypothetical protein